MKRIGTALLICGALIGAAVGTMMLTGVHVAGMSWLVSVIAAKLTLAGAAALMTGGAFCLRLGRKRADREALASEAQSGRP